MRMWVKEGGKLQDHLDEFESLAYCGMDLVNLGKEVSNEDKALLLIVSLPPFYQGL